MRHSTVERARIMTSHREAVAFEEAKEKLSGAAPSTSPNAADSNRVAVKKALQAELKRHRVAAEPVPDGPPPGAGGSKKGGRGEGYTA